MQMRSLAVAAATALVLGSSITAGVATAQPPPPDPGQPGEITTVDPAGGPAPGWGGDGRSRSAPAPSTSATVTTPGATFVFTYREPVRPELKRVFEEAGRQWGAVVSSAVPIQVVAREIDNPDPVGIANSQGRETPAVTDPRLRPNTFYTRPLVNAILGADQDPPGSPNSQNAPECVATGCDMLITIAGGPSQYYYGLDGSTPADRVDALGLVLHEIGHGLGFTSRVLVESGVGRFAGAPTIYDRFLVDATGRRLTDVPNPSPAFAQAVQTPSVAFDGPATVLAQRGPVRVFTTNPHTPGVSLIHLSVASVSRQSVMVSGAQPGAGFEGVPRRIDGPTAAILADLGWPQRTRASVQDTVTAERVAVINFPVTLSQKTSVPVTIGYRTVDGTAKAGEDYTARNASITIPAGGQAAFISIPVVADQRREGTETMSVQLTTVAGAGVDKGTASGQILDP